MSIQAHPFLCTNAKCTNETRLLKTSVSLSMCYYVDTGGFKEAEFTVQSSIAHPRRSKFNCQYKELTVPKSPQRSEIQPLSSF